MATSCNVKTSSQKSTSPTAYMKLKTMEDFNLNELTGSEIVMFNKLCKSFSNYYTERLCQIQQPLCSPQGVKSVLSDVYLLEKGTTLDQEVKKRDHKLYSYERIFFPCASTSSRRLLLFGHPGSGKTTLAAKLASDWVNSRDDPISDWFETMLVVLPLRHILPEMSFVEGVKYILAREVHYDNDSLQDLLSKLKGRLYIIFDGFDEVNPDTLRGSKVSGAKDGCTKCTLTIDTIIHGGQLPDAHVLVITQPSALPYFTEGKELSTFEICGFEGKKRIKMFIQNSFIDNPELGEGLWKVIDGNGFLIDISKTPMFLALLCGLVQDESDLMKDFETTKKMGPFLKLCLDSFLLHFVKKLIQLGKGKAMLEKFKGKMEYLTERLRILALDGLVDNQKQTWESQYVKDFLEETDAHNMSQEKRKDLLGSGDEMDLFTFAQESGILRVISPHGMSRRRSKLKEKHIGYQEIVSFYHKLFQEKCAGDYLGQMAIDNHTEFKKYLAKLNSKSEVLSMKCLFHCACYRGKWEATRAILDHLIQMDFQTPSEVAILFECFYENPDGCRSQSVGFDDLMSVKKIVVKYSDSSYTKDAFLYGLKSLSEIQKLELKGCSVEYNQDICSVLVEKEVEELKISGEALVMFTKIRPMPFLKKLVLSLKVFSEKAMNALLDWSLKSSAQKPKEIIIQGKKSISWQDLSGSYWKIVTNATHKTAVVELKGCQNEYQMNKEGKWEKLRSEKVMRQQQLSKGKRKAGVDPEMNVPRYQAIRGKGNGFASKMKIIHGWGQSPKEIRYAASPAEGPQVEVPHCRVREHSGYEDIRRPEIIPFASEEYERTPRVHFEQKLECEMKVTSQQESSTEESYLALGSNDMSATKFIDQGGGTICIENFGVELTIPQDALASEGAQITISVPSDEVDAPNDFDFVVSLAPVIKLAPSNLKFLKPFTLKVPHCAVIAADEDAGPIAVVYVGHKNEVGEIIWMLDTEKTRIISITEESFIIESTHFTWWRTVFSNFRNTQKGLKVCAVCDSCVEVPGNSSSTAMYRMMIDIWWCNSYIDSKLLAPGKKLLKENFIAVARYCKEPLMIFLKKTIPEWSFSDKDMKAERSFSHNALWSSTKQQLSFTIEGSRPAPLCQFTISFKQEVISLEFETQHCLPSGGYDVYTPPPTPNGLDKSSNQLEPQTIGARGDHNTGSKSQKKREDEIINDSLIATVARALCGELYDNFFIVNLEMKDHILKRCKKNYQDIESFNREMLYEWRRKEQEAATPKRLLQLMRGGKSGIALNVSVWDIVQKYILICEITC